MDGFVAGRDLPPEDFKNFSKQCIGSYERASRNLQGAISEAKAAQERVDYWSRRMSEERAYCAKHGVSLHAV